MDFIGNASTISGQRRDQQGDIGDYAMIMGGFYIDSFRIITPLRVIVYSSKRLRILHESDAAQPARTDRHDEISFETTGLDQELSLFSEKSLQQTSFAFMKDLALLGIN